MLVQRRSPPFGSLVKGTCSRAAQEQSTTASPAFLICSVSAGDTVLVPVGLTNIYIHKFDVRHYLRYVKMMPLKRVLSLNSSMTCNLQSLPPTTPLRVALGEVPHSKSHARFFLLLGFVVGIEGMSCSRSGSSKRWICQKFGPFFKKRCPPWP